MAIIAMFGPLANLLLASVVAILIRMNGIFNFSSGVLNIFITIVYLNVLWMVFNLVPIPPLDGSKILIGLLPASLSAQYASFERYGFIVLFIFIWLGVFDRLLWPLVNTVTRLMGVGG